MILNLLVTAIKFVVGALTGSIAVLADAFNALVDASSNVIGLLGLRAASDPPDPIIRTASQIRNHRRWASAAVLLAGWEVLKISSSAWRRTTAHRYAALPGLILLLCQSIPSSCGMKAGAA
jgi:hypothetical protein